MTNSTPHGQVPAIQRYKIGYHSDEWGQRSSTPSGIPDASGSWVRYEDHASELRRLHAYCQELESQVVLDCMTHVQNPAEIEHVAGVVSKNGAELNMTGSAMRASHGQAPAQAAPAAVAGTHVTDAMALAFHSALSDGAIGSDEVEETKAGLRAALAASPTTVNRYCRAGMCVPSDTKHEPWCTAHRDREIESLRARSVAPAGEYPALPDDSEAFNAAWQIASHGHAQAAPQPSPAAQGDARMALSDELEALAKRHGALSYRNRADTQNPAFGFSVAGLESLLAEVRRRDEALIRQLVEALEDFDDAGPLGEGWKSDRLLSLLASARARLEGKP